MEFSILTSQIFYDMSTNSEIGAQLTFYETFDKKMVITLKSKRYNPFVAKVKDYNFNESDTQVIFKRCEETVFPNDSENEKKEEYMTYIKNIKSIASYKEDKK